MSLEFPILLIFKVICKEFKFMRPAEREGLLNQDFRWGSRSPGASGDCSQTFG